MRQQIRNPKSEIPNPDNFRRTFLNDSIDKLIALENEIEKDFSESLRRDAFRAIHTVKGGAQTFDLPKAARIAHELETMLSGGAAEHDTKPLAEGIAFLIDSLRRGDEETDADFIEELRRPNKKASKKTPAGEILLIALPREVLRSLSAQEKAATASALGAGKNIFCIEVGFEAAKFAAGYRDLQQLIVEKGEILASLPGEKYQREGKIGFRIVFASREPAEKLSIALADFDARITAFEQNDSDALREMFRRIVAHGESLAEKSGKEIRFTIFSNGAPPLAGDKLNDFFEILLHLVRNAVDHAIEKSGAVEIFFLTENDELHVSVADDGGGIDLPKVRARAVAKNLISDEDVLTEHETVELIFAPEFSTADRLTEISGRGVGLDAVKHAVEKINGKISARNRKSKGAIFEIIVPTNKV